MTKYCFRHDTRPFHLSHLLHPLTYTWVYCCFVHFTYSPGILHLILNGDEVQLREHKTCSSEKGICVLVVIHLFPIQYVLR